MSTPTLFYQPSSSSTSSADITALQTQMTALKTDVDSATAVNSNSTLVKRDTTGGFAAGTVKLDAIESNGTTLDIAGLNGTSTVNLGKGTGVQTINMGNNGSGATTINLGGTGDTVNVGTVAAPAGAMTLYPSGMALNGRIVNGNTYFPADLNLNAVAADAGYTSGFVSNSGRILLSGRCHNSVSGPKPSTSGIQSQVMQNNVNPVQTKLVFLTSSTAGTSPNIVESASIDNNGMFSCTSVSTSAIESSGTTLTIAGQNNTSVVDIGKGTGVQAINIGNNGTGATTINLGGGSDAVRVNLPLKNASGSDVFNVGTTACFVGSIGNPSGAGNTFVGTGISTTVGKFGTYNTGMGNLTLAALDTGGDYNVAMGVQALGGVTTGQFNVAVGARAGWDPLPAKCQITGTGCTFIGTDSKPNNVTPLVNATALGSQAVVDASNTIQLGHVGLVAVKTAGTHYAAGLESIGTTLTIAGQNNTSVVDIGKGTSVQTINVGNNGVGATTINLGGGSDAVQVNLPLKDSAGATILNAISGSNGDSSLFVGGIGNHTGKGNTYCGTQISTVASKFGEYNTAMGSLALSLLDIGGNENVAIGHRALAAVSTGTGNVGIGTRAGHDVSNAANRITTGSNCTFIGTDAKGSATGLANATAIGAGAMATTSNTIQLGNASITEVRTSGIVVSSAIPTAGNHLTNKTYVDGKFTTLSNQNLKTTDTATFAGLILPTTGGTAATLSHYEEYVHNTAFSSATFTSTLGLLFARVGKVVTMTFPFTVTFTATSTTKLSNSVIVPTRFRPFGNLFSHLEMVDNGTRVDGLVEFSDGFITISPAHSADFITGRAYTVYGFSMTWVLQ